MYNPFTPGNGVEPKYLAGRREYLQEFSKSLDAFENGLPQNTAVYGLRGTGKTVLARHYKVLAANKGWNVIEREFNEKYSDEEVFGNTFSTDIVTSASEISLKKKLESAGKDLVDALKPETLTAYGIIYRPYYKEKRNNLVDYLKEAMIKNWDVFEKAGKKGVVCLYDETHNIRDMKENNQYVLSSLLEAFSYVQREGYRYYLCVCGLPNLKTNLKDAKTYTERMFNFQETGNLATDEARKALTEPLKNSGYLFEESLISDIVAETRGYPYFLQFYGYFLIDNAAKEKITGRDFQSARKDLLERLDKSFFEDRFNKASDKEKIILVSMSKSAHDAVPLNEIKRSAKMDYNNLLQLLIRLTEKGLVFRPTRGKYSFTIPLFKEYILREC